MYHPRIGIAIGPRTWFNDRYGSNVSFSGSVYDNVLSGAFGFGIAITSARNFTVQDNILVGNTSFIGSRGPNCTDESTISSVPFLVAYANVTDTTLQSDFQSVPNGDGLTCIVPPEGGDYWPYGGQPSSSSTPPSTTLQPTASNNNKLSSGAKTGIAIGVICGFVIVATATWFIRKWALRRQELRYATSYGDGKPSYEFEGRH